MPRPPVTTWTINRSTMAPTTAVTKVQKMPFTSTPNSPRTNPPSKPPKMPTMMLPRIPSLLPWTTWSAIAPAMPPSTIHTIHAQSVPRTLANTNETSANTGLRLPPIHRKSRPTAGPAECALRLPSLPRCPRRPVPAGLHRATHAAVPDRRRVRPCPMQPPDRRTQRLAICRSDAGRHVCGVPAARPLLLRPAVLHVLRGIAGTLAEVAHQALEDGGAPLLCRFAHPLPSFVALDEAEQDTRLAALRRVVEGDADGATITGCLARQPFVAPEWLWIETLHPRDGAHRHALRELVAMAW